jgi:hypothetical protein
MSAIFAGQHTLAIDQGEASPTSWFAVTISQNLVSTADTYAPVVFEFFAVIAYRDAVTIIESSAISANRHTGFTLYTLALVTVRDASPSVVSFVHLADRLAPITVWFVTLLAVRNAAVVFRDKTHWAVWNALSIYRLESVFTDRNTPVIGLGKPFRAICYLGRCQHNIRNARGHLVECIRYDVV